jgi:hypothetical protein
VESPSPGFSQRNGALNRLGLVDRLQINNFSQPDIIAMAKAYKQK